MLRSLLVALCLFAMALCSCRQASNSKEPVASVKILVHESGLYRVEAEELQDVGFPVDALEAGAIRLSEAGQEVAYALQGNDLIFYGRSSTSRYTAFRPYVLDAHQDGTLMSSEVTATSGAAKLPSVQRTIHFEENLEYVSDARVGPHASPWFWQTVGLQGSSSVEIQLPAVANGAGRLRASLYGATHHAAADPDHTLRLSINGRAVAEPAWDGQTVYTATITLPAGTFRTGTNVLQLENIPEDFLDLSRLDWVEIQYESQPLAEDAYLEFSAGPGMVSVEGFEQEPIVVDVSDVTNPVLLTGWEYGANTATVNLPHEGQFVIASGDGFLRPAGIEEMLLDRWNRAEQQADVLILTTAELTTALEPLVTAREEQGLEVALVSVEEIYDTFGHGAATPESINHFLQFALEMWQRPSPRYLLLVGDATIDYWGYLSGRPTDPIQPPENIIPPFLVPVTFGGETVSDARLGDVDGDYVPDLAVGRWPVDSVAEVRELVRRTLEYEESATTRHAIFAADGSSPEFERMASRIIRESNFPPDNSLVLTGPSPEALADRWAEGAWLVTYSGHGSLELWGRDGMLTTDSVGSLSHTGLSPIVFQLTCLTALFAHPETTSLSEVMLTQEDGPVLIIGATSLTLSAHQEPFAVALLESLQDPSVERVGDAMQRARRTLDTNSIGIGLREINDTFVLLGDPSARVMRPQ